MDEDGNQNFGAVIGDGIAWSVVLVPTALAALLLGLPYLLEILGEIFDGMRAFAEAVKG
jgi:hypothetical protein